MLHPIRRYARQACFPSSCARIYARSHTLSHILSRSYANYKFDLPTLDEKWQTIWEKNQLDRDGKKTLGQELEKMYILPMFPYPSGDLHLGHLRVYTISDVLARFRRMQGYDVIHPIGWDAFGLPAENAAIERGIDPASWTKTNIKKMRSQLRAMNGHWDWDREFATCDPNFYKHTQRLFLLLHQRGLAYQAESLVNYDPVDKTVLANEQVDVNGCSWRSGAKVEKRLLKQWFLKISEFREQLLEGFELLDGAWPERVLAMQRNWLGKSTGAQIKFPVVAYDQRSHSAIEVFTTRPDTIFGVQYLALASTHPIVEALAQSDVELQAFLNTMTTLPPDSKVGYLLPHVRAVNPLAYEEATPDATKASLPIYVAPYVVGDYGNGAVMGVPGHDTRDHAFWSHNRCDEPIRMVIAPSPHDSSAAIKNGPFVHPGYLTSHSGPYQGQSTAEAAKKITDLLQFRGLGSAAETWRLRDWLISRQRYWGTPIPIIHCDSCGPVPVPEHQLPVELPPVEGHWMKGKAGNPLENAHDWVNTLCPNCHAPAKRDTDTMDTFVDSSWYFMRFIDPNNENMLFSPNIADKVLPVDIYIGGVEHAILHLLYARFISKFIASTSLWNSKNGGEPFKQVLTQGMVHGKTYSDPSNERFLKPNELDLSQPSNPVVVATGATANVSFEKMSKSKYNGVDPGICMSKYGADATRAHILFQAPVSEILEWDEEKISGITRWLRRIHDHINQMSPLWELSTELQPSDDFHPKSFLNSSKTYQLNNAKQSPQPQNTMPNPVIQGSKMEDVNSSLEVLKACFEADKKLWHGVQSTVVKVTESYSKTFSLNTVVSDLMALTNTIIDNAQQRLEIQEKLGKRHDLEVRLSRQATMTLIQMMAPITPAFAEECWTLLHPHAPSIQNPTDHSTAPSYAANRQPTSAETSSVPSIFSHPFPTPDGTLALLAPQSQPCAVQINGKLKFVVEIPVPQGLDATELETWVVDGIVASEEGKRRLTGKMDVKNARKVIVIRGGKTVNFVL